MNTFRTIARQAVANGVPMEELRLFEEELPSAQRFLRHFPQVAAALKSIKGDVDERCLTEQRLDARLARFKQQIPPPSAQALDSSSALMPQT